MVRNEDTNESNTVPQRLEPQVLTVFQPKVVDNPVNQNTAVAAYYKEDDNSLSTMRFSATRTIIQYPQPSSNNVTQCTLGNLEGTVVSTTPSHTSTMKSPETQTTPSTIPNSDTQPVASSVTMEIFFTNFERQQAQRDKL